MTDLVADAPNPVRIPLKKRKDCYECREKSREYAQVCAACDDMCLCTACEAKGVARMAQTNCCNNYYCVDCADNASTEITVVCPRCKRAGCVVCFDGRCVISDKLFCDQCLRQCVSCGQEMRLKEFSLGCTRNDQAVCNGCYKEEQMEDKKRKRDDTKKAATEILKQHGLENAFDKDEDSD